MKKAMMISYDADRLKALRLYMGQKDKALDTELVKALDELYLKFVPANVRFFLEAPEEPVQERGVRRNRPPDTSGGEVS